MCAGSAQPIIAPRTGFVTGDFDVEQDAPSWLGVGQCLDKALSTGHKREIETMYKEWPFFRATIDLIEMVVAKADPTCAARYDRRLVPPELQGLGEDLRKELQTTIDRILEVALEHGG